MVNLRISSIAMLVLACIAGSLAAPSANHCEELMTPPTKAQLDAAKSLPSDKKGSGLKSYGFNGELPNYPGVSFSVSIVDKDTTDGNSIPPHREYKVQVEESAALKGKGKVMPAKYTFALRSGHGTPNDVVKTYRVDGFVACTFITAIEKHETLATIKTVDVIKA